MKALLPAMNINLSQTFLACILGLGEYFGNGA